MSPNSIPVSKVAVLPHEEWIGMSSKLLVSREGGRNYKDVESDIPWWLGLELPLQLLPRLPYHTDHTWSTFCTALQVDGNADKNVDILILGRLDDRYS